MTARRELEALISELSELERAQPTRPGGNAGYRAAVAALAGEIAGVLARRWPPWIRAQEAERLAGRGRRLLAESTRVARIAGLAERAAERLGRLPAATADAALAAWIARERTAAEALLASVGCAHREAELEAEEALLGELENRLVRLEGVAALVLELARALECLPARPDVAPLAARLEALRAEALAGRAEAEWVLEARRFLAPLARLAPSPPVRPPDREPEDGARAELLDLLNRLEGWAEAVGDAAASASVSLWLAGLAEATPQDLRERRQRAAERLSEVIAVARATRDGQRLAMRRQYEDYVAQCGSPPEGEELEAQLATLGGWDVSEPVDHEAWLRSLELFAGRLDNLVGLQEQALGKALGDRLAAVAEELASGTASILPAELSARRMEIEAERAELSRGATRRDVLARLVRAEDLLARARELAADIAAERAEVARLVSRRDELLGALSALPRGELAAHQWAERDRALGGLEAWRPPADGGRETLAALVARGEDVLDGLGLAERHARERQASLLAQLEELRLAGLDGFETGFLDHVEALLRGVSEAPLEGVAAAHQLDVASARLGRYERQARHRAANEVHRVTEKFRRALQGHLPEAFRKEAERLLCELERHRREELPPLGWRRRAMGLEAQLGGVDHE